MLWGVVDQYASVDAVNVARISGKCERNHLFYESEVTAGSSDCTMHHLDAIMLCNTSMSGMQLHSLISILCHYAMLRFCLWHTIHETTTSKMQTNRVYCEYTSAIALDWIAL